MHIEKVTAAELPEVLPLIAAYQEFYEALPDAERNQRHFGQIVADASRGMMFLARDDSAQALGVATLYFVPSSVRATRQCVMNDLYVVPAARSQGVGRALIERCRAEAQTLGYAALLWTTATSNKTAQLLYDSIGGTSTAWLHYRLPTSTD